MTDNEIIKKLDILSQYDGLQRIHRFALHNAIYLTNRQKAEIERWLKKEKQDIKDKYDCQQTVYCDLSDIIKEKCKELELANADKVIAETHEKAAKEMFVDVTQQLKTAKSEAIKEFMNRLKKCRCIHDGTKADMIFWYHIEYIAKEMTEE